MTTADVLTPFVAEAPDLIEEARGVLRAADGLGARLSEPTLNAVAELLRRVNTYYSNLIEGHVTYPADVERAMAGDYAADPAKRDLQLEALAHIEVQKLVEERIAADPHLNVCDPGFLLMLHRAFYDRLPDAMHIVRSPDGHLEEHVVGGALRSFDVTVGDHHPPKHEALGGLMASFGTEYDPAKYMDRPAGPERERALLAAAAAHHRFLYIHPFGDGNGRVARLLTDAYFKRIHAGGHGLWTVSRGLARQSDEYRDHLHNADAARWNDYDGRGSRSLRGLERWSRFFLGVCADQIAYMGGLVDFDSLAERADAYGRARESGVLGMGSAPMPRHEGRGRPPAGAPKGTARVLRALVTEGRLFIRDIPRVGRVAERTAYRIADLLLADGLATGIRERTAPGPMLLIHFPAHAIPYLFPDLARPGT